MNEVPPLLAPDALAGLPPSTVKMVDARFKMPGILPKAEDDYLAAHIPGAVFFDIDRIAAGDTDLPHMLPGPDVFAAAIGMLGIGDDDWVVLYDAAGISGAARAWWMFRTFGHDRVSILDGGLSGWRAAGLPVEPGLVEPLPASYVASFDPRLVRSSEQILANLVSHQEQVVDARSAGRFNGVDKEPWPGRRSGHIPGSLNVDHTTLLDKETGRLREPAEIERRFTEAGVDLSRPIVTSCGSGITACALAFGLHLTGHEAAVFDGSWAEWGLGSRFPVEAEPAKIS